MAYDHACETFRFASRNEHFALAIFRFIMRQKRNRLAARPSSSDRPERTSGLAVEKVRESALKRLKSLSRVTLCASASGMCRRGAVALAGPPPPGSSSGRLRQEMRGHLIGGWQGGLRA